jgi:hypothetical protein
MLYVIVAPGHAKTRNVLVTTPITVVDLNTPRDTQIIGRAGDAIHVSSGFCLIIFACTSAYL